MKIEINDQSKLYDISVIIEGECNHADTYFEEEEHGIYKSEGQDDIWYVTVEICNKCKCYRFKDDPDHEWQGVSVWPIN